MPNKLAEMFSSFPPLRYLRAAGIFLLALFAALAAQRHYRRSAHASRRANATATRDQAARHRARAAEEAGTAHAAREKARRQIRALRQRGHTSMANKIEAMNDL